VTTEVIKKCLSLDRLISQSPVLAIALCFLVYQERQEQRQMESVASREKTIIELQKSNHKVLEDLTAAVREMSVSLESLKNERR
jgi:hypothetical protein